MLKYHVNYPNITIQVKDQVLSLEFNADKDTSKTMFVLEPSLNFSLESAAKSVGFKFNSVDDILAFARLGDEKLMEFAKFNLEVADLNVEDILNGLQQQVADRNPEYAEGASSEVNEALDEFWRADMLASFLEEIYSLVIAKAVFNASELGINTIVLNDERNEIRLQEKVGKEITAVPELELIVV